MNTAWGGLRVIFEIAEKPLLVVDADTFVWWAALDIEKEAESEERDEGEWLAVGMEFISSYIGMLRSKTATQKAVFALTLGRESFRFQIFPEYKPMKSRGPRPKFLAPLKKFLIENYNNVVGCTLIEADDYVVWLAKQQKSLLCSVDKDVLNALPGGNWDYKKNEIRHISKSFAMFWPYFQCLTGDTADGIKGAAGIGPKKALQYVNEDMDEKALWAGVLEGYKDDYESALLNMRLVNMHQFNGKGVDLWKTE